MSKKQHRIAADVKADILRRVKEEGISVAQAAKEHHMDVSLEDLKK
jgi:transposase-like protein